jgi:hypothetical protein
MTEIYEASPVKRRRATTHEMEERAEFLIKYAEEHGPVTVRQLYYQCEVHGVPGIDKDDSSYAKVQRQILQLRREKRLSYNAIADATRWMRKPESYDGPEAAIRDVAQLYRKALWRDTDSVVEVWIEKDALAGVIYPITSLFDVPLMVTRGFSSETFCYTAVEAHENEDRPVHIYYLGDYDRAGKDAALSLQEKLERFGEEFGVEVVFEQIAVSILQIVDLMLPTREPKRVSAADRKWPFAIACELDAIEPDHLRTIVREAIEQHLPQREYEILKVAEASERQLLQGLVA